MTPPPDEPPELPDEVPVELSGELPVELSGSVSTEAITEFLLSSVVTMKSVL